MVDPLPEQNQEKRHFWQSHIDAWGLTGLSQAEYCRQNNLKTSRFTYWKQKLHRENLPVEFVQISTEPANFDHVLQGNEVPCLRLTVGSQFTIEIPDGFSPATLEQVLLTLRRV